MPDSCDSRRDFLSRSCRLGVLLAIGAPLATALAACDSGGGGDTPTPSDGVTLAGRTLTLDLSKSGASPLAAAGGFLYVAAANTVLVNVEGEVRAFSSECPHEGRPVNRFENGQLVCPTHGSRFSTTGAVVSTPARSPLTRFTATRSGSIVTVTLA